MLPKGRKSKKYDFLVGGLVTRPDDRYINLLNDKGHYFSPNESNADFQKIASIQKRLGYTFASAVTGTSSSEMYSSGSATHISGPTQVATDGQIQAICHSFAATSTNNIIVVSAKIHKNFAAGVANNLMRTVRCLIKADNAGSPGTTLGTSDSLTDLLECGDGAFLTTNFYFPTYVALTNTTTYWVCFECLPHVGSNAAGLFISYRGKSSSGTTKLTSDNYGTFTTSTFTPDIEILMPNVPVLGIYEYKPEAAGVITQFRILAAQGILGYDNGAAGTTNIATGLASSFNSLYDFSTLKNLLFSCDYATNNNQAWDGAFASTMTHGYRGTFSIGQSGSAGGPWSAAGVVKVMLVTQLISGGYRCSTVSSITLAGTTNKIDLSSIAVNAVAAQFAFDIASTATTVYCTLPNGAIFYKVPAASLSTAGNPIANSQTTNSILPMTDATLIAGGTFESNLGYPQGYATGQVNTPKSKYLEVFQNMLAMAGDPNNASRVWFSEQYAPQVWGNGDSGTGVQGDFLDIAVDDGELITGLAVADGALMVGKPSAIYRVDFTGNSFDSWIVRKVHGQVGVLSNWSMQVIPDGLFFLSERGPAICYGTYSDILPQTRLIQNLFDNTSPDSFNLASMAYSVACNDTTRNQIIFTVSGTGVTFRNRLMTYDYTQKMFSPYVGYEPNYIANISDTNGFPVLWAGGLSGQVFKRSSNYLDGSLVTADLGPPVILTVNTPEVDFGDPSTWAQVEWLHVAGKTQTSGNLYLDFFVDGSTDYWTRELDMTSSLFKNGLAIRVGVVSKDSITGFGALTSPGVSGCEIHWIRLEYQ